MLDDPNTLLRNDINGLHITETSAISISTSPALPLFGSGTDNIPFLWGDAGAVTRPDPAGQNAQAVRMIAIFWIETVQHTIIVPPYRLGQHALTLKPKPTEAGQPVPTFNVRPPIPITGTAPRPLPHHQPHPVLNPQLEHV